MGTLSFSAPSSPHRLSDTGDMVQSVHCTDMRSVADNDGRKPHFDQGLSREPTRSAHVKGRQEGMEESPC